MKPLLPGIVRIRALSRPKESLVNFLPIDRVECKIILCGIHNPEVATLPTVSHWARETLSLHKLTGADCLILAIVYGLKKCFKSYIILYAPVADTFRPIFRPFEKKPPRRCMGKFDRGSVQSTTPIIFSASSTRTFSGRKSSHQIGNGPVLWRNHFSLNLCSQTSPRKRSRATNLRRQSSSESTESFL